MKNKMQKNVETYHFKKFSLLKYAPLKESDRTSKYGRVVQDRAKQYSLLEEFFGVIERIVFGVEAIPIREIRYYNKNEQDIERR